MVQVWMPPYVKYVQYLLSSKSTMKVIIEQFASTSLVIEAKKTIRANKGHSEEIIMTAHKNMVESSATSIRHGVQEIDDFKNNT